LALRGLKRSEQRRPDRAGARLAEHLRVHRDRPTGLRLAGVDRRLHGEVDDALSIEARGERGPHPPDRLLELRALALDFVDLRSQLRGHAVELAAQLGELVATLGRNGLVEVAARQAARRFEELADLLLERPRHEDRGGER
jgi:hypothetical protein